MSTGATDWAAAETSTRGDGAMVAQPPPPDYSDFLAGKASGVPEHGRTVDALIAKLEERA